LILSEFLEFVEMFRELDNLLKPQYESF
jgi:hypothetical protein